MKRLTIFTVLLTTLFALSMTLAVDQPTNDPFSDISPSATEMILGMLSSTNVAITPCPTITGMTEEVNAIICGTTRPDNATAYRALWDIQITAYESWVGFAPWTQSDFAITRWYTNATTQEALMVGYHADTGGVVLVVMQAEDTG